MAVRLHLTHISELDQLVALEYDWVEEGTPEEWWRPTDGHVGYLYDGGTGRPLGSKVYEFSRLDVDVPELSEIWLRLASTSGCWG